MDSNVSNADYVINQSDLKEMFSYCVDSGVFVYAKDTPRKKTGDVVGYVNKGYLYTSVRGKQYNLSRLAWMYVYGVFPDNCIDHIDHDRKNNRIDNLRDVTHKENSRNQSLRKNTKSGHNGVYWCEPNEEWEVYFNGITDHSFKTYPEAVTKRKELQVKNGYHANHSDSKGYNHRDSVLKMYKDAGVRVH